MLPVSHVSWAAFPIEQARVSISASLIGQQPPSNTPTANGIAVVNCERVKTPRNGRMGQKYMVQSAKQQCPENRQRRDLPLSYWVDCAAAARTSLADASQRTASVSG